MKEIWRSIEGYKGLYHISNYGRVKRLGNKFSRKEKIMSLVLNERGYLCVALSKKRSI